MKIYLDNGELLGEYPDNASLLVFDDTGVVAIISEERTGEDNDEMTVSAGLAAATLVFLHNAEKQEEVIDFFHDTIRGAH